MPRSGAAARIRLREAALELYGARGFDATTTAQIAERAGVTERTFFRHFADKREVLFEGETELCDVLSDAVRTAPADLATLAVLERAFIAAVPLFVAGRRVAVLRQPVIDAAPALQERAHAKSAAVVDALAQALAARGLEPLHAQLAAQVGTAAFRRAVADWAGESGDELTVLITKATDEVRTLG
jgi:AcrR family transcriptional regulator